MPILPKYSLSFRFMILAMFFVMAGSGIAFAQQAQPEDDAETAPPGVEQNQQDDEPDQQAENEDGADKDRKVTREGSMTLEQMDKIIRRLSEEVNSPREGTWQFVIEDRAVLIVTDAGANRMRVMVPVVRESEIKPEDWKRISQANFDSALDARYALAREILWATFIHPLSELHTRQFISGIGQAVNLSITYGTTYSSGAMSFNGGDSNEILRQQFIEELQKKGEEV